MSLMEIKEIQNKSVIKKILTTPLLFEATEGSTAKVSDFRYDPTFKYLLCTQDNKNIGLFRIRPITLVLLEVHCHILPQYWGTGKSLEAAEAGFDYVRKTTQTKKVFTYVPSICHHVINYMTKIGYKACGQVHEGIIYNGQFTTLFLFEYDLRG